MTKRPVNENAMKALEEMNLEIANELGFDYSKGNVAIRMMARDLAKVEEKQLTEEDRDTFYPI